MGGLGWPVIMLGAGAMATALALAIALIGGGDGGRKLRVDKVVQRARRLRGEGPATAAVNLDKTVGHRRPLERLAARLMPRPQMLRDRLARTGMDATLGQYFLANGACFFVVAGGLWRFGGLSVALALLIGLSLGLGLPHMSVGYLIRRRRARFNGLFAGAIDLIVRGLKSGLPVSESMSTVAAEIQDPVGIEFQAITDGLKIGQTMEEALWHAAARVDTPEFRFFVIALSIQRETGGNLAETLENLSDVLRKRRQTKLKIKAMSSEANASAMIIGSLPFIMFGIIHLLSPRYLSILFTDSRGHMMLGVGLFWLALGFGVMTKMVRFEI